MKGFSQGARQNDWKRRVRIQALNNIKFTSMPVKNTKYADFFSILYHMAVFHKFPPATHAADPILQKWMSFTGRFL